MPQKDSRVELGRDKAGRSPQSHQLVMRKHVLPIATTDVEEMKGVSSAPFLRHPNHLSNPPAETTVLTRTDAMLDIVTSYFATLRGGEHQSPDYVRLYQLVTSSLFP